ncbi:MAG: hypothetical protein ACXVA9_03575, partial [Bdellovibrionales bacterium]
VPVNTISQCPGQGYNYSPALSQVPPAQGQYMASQLAGMCPYPGMMANLNTAYSAPTYFPVQQQVARPVGPPGFLPFARRPSATATLKPLTVKPQALRPALKFAPATVDPAGAAK